MQFRSELVKYVRKIIGDIPEVEDVVQDTLLVSLEKAETLQNPDLYKHWLFKIARNKSIDFLKSRQQQPLAGSVSDLDMADEHQSSALMALAENNIETYQGVKERFLHQQQAVSEVKKYLQSVIPNVGIIPDAYLEALLLEEFYELSQQEIADKLQVPLPTAKSRIQRGRQKAKEVMLMCCAFEFDCRGSVMDYTQHEK
jgi:RNA polymerase sigma-70 factor (ECF subfamily)